MGDRRGRRRAVLLVAAAVALLLAAVTIVVLSARQVEDDYRDVLAACASADFPDDLRCGGEDDSAAAALDHAVGPVDTSTLAGVLATAGLVLLASLVPPRGGIRAFLPVAALLVVQLLLFQLHGVLDYKSCEEPGYNDASAARVIGYDVTVLVLLLWPTAAAMLALVRLVATRRDWLAHLATILVSVAVLLASAVLLVAMSSC